VLRSNVVALWWLASGVYLMQRRRDRERAALQHAAARKDE